MFNQEQTIRFYQWAIRDSNRQIDDDYLLLRTVQSPIGMAYLQMVRTMTPKDQKMLAVACLNWAHQDARTLLGEEATLEDQNRRQDYLQFLSQNQPLIVKGLYERLRQGAAAQKRSHLTAVLKQEMESILGSDFRQEADHLIFITPLEQYFVGTRIQITRDCRLRYWQNVMKSKTSPVGLVNGPMHNGTNFLSWLGLGQSEWELPCLEDAEPGAKSLALVCRHFIDNCPYFV